MNTLTAGIYMQNLAGQDTWRVKFPKPYLHLFCVTFGHILSAVSLQTDLC